MPEFCFAQYLENELTEFHQILYMHSYWQDIGWDCRKFLRELRPFI